jgi:GxxExxY protein
MHVNEITGQIVDAAIKVHRTLGPGLLESVYEIVLAYELVKRGFTVARQQAIPIVYETMTFDDAFRADLIVNNLVIVELKSIEAIAPVHKKQLLTYLRLSGRHVGLLINFNVELLKDGLTRIVDNLPE